MVNGNPVLLCNRILVQLSRAVYVVNWWYPNLVHLNEKVIETPLYVHEEIHKHDQLQKFYECFDAPVELKRSNQLGY